MRTVNGVRVPVLNAKGEPVTIPEIITPDESVTLHGKLQPTPENVARGKQTGGRKTTRWLAGVIECGSCGRYLVFSQAHNAGKGMYFCRHDASGGCPRPPYISSALLEDHVERAFLAAFGDLPEYVRRREVTGAAELADAGAALTAMTNELTPEAIAKLQEAQARRDAAKNAPRKVTERITATGRTMRDTWKGTAENPEARRELLRANYASIVGLRFSTGNKGSKKWDPRRVVMVANPPTVLEHAELTYRHGLAVVKAA
ncbi:zinc ribbon domain-containing protein [Amycolatopsis coloradensis]|uniref:Zinc ribbon domain-containing protein n=1 Tax=Amycolatopsis coloradensis TaxID=76021 RepID=A0ACD5BJ46_9PSEU